MVPTTVNQTYPRATRRIGKDSLSVYFKTPGNLKDTICSINFGISYKFELMFLIICLHFKRPRDSQGLGQHAVKLGDGEPTRLQHFSTFSDLRSRYDTMNISPDVIHIAAEDLAILPQDH